ncbi:MAG: CBS domain-containing protein [Sandaracinaceae bacterium]|nr:CBS domain-containing protein [Sandaracinaceae bacterium]
MQKPTLVSDLMSTDLFTLPEDADLPSASELMRLERVRHIPVVKGKRLVGLITHRDLLRAQAKLLLQVAGARDDDDDRVVSLRVTDVMNDALLTCRPNEPADDAARLMLDARVGCVLVVEDDELVGILTETDVMAWAVEVMAKHRFETEPPPRP